MCTVELIENIAKEMPFETEFDFELIEEEIKK
jgi:hypothetical protein